jgi:hypothetical protein
MKELNNTQIVGDSPKGPLNNRGETRLKPEKTQNAKSTCTPNAHTKHNHDPGGPRGPPGQHNRRPSSEVRLARGLSPASLEGRAPPRAGSASLEGSAPPLERDPPRSRAEHPLGRAPPRSRAPTLAFPASPHTPVPAHAYGHLML